MGLCIHLVHPTSSTRGVSRPTSRVSALLSDYLARQKWVPPTLQELTALSRMGLLIGTAPTCPGCYFHSTRSSWATNCLVLPTCLCSRLAPFVTYVYSLPWIVESPIPSCALSFIRPCHAGAVSCRIRYPQCPGPGVVRFWRSVLSGANHSGLAACGCKWERRLNALGERVGCPSVVCGCACARG
jgi:hypothetical protein